MTLSELRKKFPQYEIRQEPNPDCHACKGEGMVTGRKYGATAPCFCAVSSEPHGPKKTAFMKAVGAAARKIRLEIESENE